MDILPYEEIIRRTAPRDHWGAIKRGLKFHHFTQTGEALEISDKPGGIYEFWVFKPSTEIELEFYEPTFEGKDLIGRSAYVLESVVKTLLFEYEMRNL